ncbi:MAG: 50S ribosomal protein L6 [Candidatus Parcubacteria bacterium]|nr:MAG: 50S ribosomal protein L6 [Candidatus Parcubacteria bacterium]
MSKIGEKPIIILEGVTIDKVNDQEIKIKGPKGEVNFSLPSNFTFVFEDKQIKIVPHLNIDNKDQLDRKTKALWGTLRSLLNNKIIGVSQGFEKVLILEGLGYGGEIRDNKLVFKIGYSHPVSIDIPSDVEVSIKPEKGKSLIYVRGIDKERVGSFAAKIKSLKKADRYHQKGFRYIDEIIKLKPVKKATK